MNDPTFGDILLWTFWAFIWIAAVMIWFRVVLDLFGDHTVSGWGKAGWVIVLVLLPWLGVLIYLIARGKDMGQRQVAAVAEQQAAQEEYIRAVAASSGSPAEQISHAKQLLDDGTISQAEFESMKAKALA